MTSQARSCLSQGCSLKVVPVTGAGDLAALSGWAQWATVLGACSWDLLNSRGKAAACNLSCLFLSATYNVTEGAWVGVYTQRRGWGGDLGAGEHSQGSMGGEPNFTVAPGMAGRGAANAGAWREVPWSESALSVYLRPSCPFSFGNQTKQTKSHSTRALTLTLAGLESTMLPW